MSNKPKCPVFGCTIPSGIPHEHSEDVSGLVEAAYRLDQDRVRNGLMSVSKFQEAWGLGSNSPKDVEPMVPGRKLRDALLLAGMMPIVPRSEVEEGVRYSIMELEEGSRLSVVQIAGRIAAGIVLAIGVASILILSAMTAGWL